MKAYEVNICKYKWCWRFCERDSGMVRPWWESGDLQRGPSKQMLLHRHVHTFKTWDAACGNMAVGPYQWPFMQCTIVIIFEHGRNFLSRISDWIHRIDAWESCWCQSRTSFWGWERLVFLSWYPLSSSCIVDPLCTSYRVQQIIPVPATLLDEERSLIFMLLFSFDISIRGEMQTETPESITKRDFITLLERHRMFSLLQFEIMVRGTDTTPRILSPWSEKTNLSMSIIQLGYSSKRGWDIWLYSVLGQAVMPIHRILNAFSCISECIYLDMDASRVACNRHGEDSNIFHTFYRCWTLGFVHGFAVEELAGL